MNELRLTGTLPAFALGLLLLNPADARAVEPDDFAVLRTSRGAKGGSHSALRMTADALPPSEGETAGERATRMLQRHRHILGPEGEGLEFVHSAEFDVPGGTHVRFTQRHRGIEVMGGEVVVSMDARGSLTMLTDAHVRLVAPERIEPELTAEEALRRASAALGATGRPIGAPDRSVLVIARGDDMTDRLVYRVSMTREQPLGDWEVLVDAVTGEIRSIEDRFVQHHGGEHVRGEGLAYRSDPLSAARALYGSPGFLDNGDADSDSLRAHRAPVMLDSLVVENGIAWLRGPFCTVSDIESPVDPQGYGEPAPYRFDYNRSQPGFEAVMVYYHASKSLQRIESLGFFLPRLRSLRLDPHGFQGADNSHYSPSGNWIGFGTGNVDDAEDADVIWHEYAHAIHFTIVPGWGGGECAALGEGYADYWAGSHTRSLGQWRQDDPQFDWIFRWDGHNEFWNGRILNDGRRYPFDGLSPHSAGQIWASALLDVQELVGRDVADRLVLKSLFYLSSGITARDAAYALLQADIDMYGGAHRDALRRVLGTERGFLPPESGSTILVLSDEPSSPGNAPSSSASPTGALGMLGSITMPSGYALRISEWSSFEPRQLLDAAVVLVLSGSNVHPLQDAGRRRKLLDYIRAGGRILVEGSDVANGMTGADVEAEFAREVLCIEGVSGPFECSQLTATDDPLFGVPHALSMHLALAPEGDTPGRYGVSPVSGDPTVAAAAVWDAGGSPAAIVTRRSPKSGLLSVFFAFAIEGTADSSLGAALLENAIFGLLENDGVTSTGAPVAGIPESILLRQNYPNPFNPSTTIQFTLAKGTRVGVRVFNLLGQAVAVLADENMTAGTHEVVWNAGALPSGVYLCRLDAGGVARTVRMVLMK